MSKKSSFNLRQYRHQTGAICRPNSDGTPNELECGSRAPSDDFLPHPTRTQIFDDEISAKNQILDDEFSSHGPIFNDATPPTDRIFGGQSYGNQHRAEQAVHRFASFRIHRHHFTITTFGILLMAGAWLGISMMRNSQIANESQDLGYEVGVEYIAGTDPNDSDEIAVPDTSGETGQESQNPGNTTASNTSKNTNNSDGPSKNTTGTSGNGQVWAPLPTDDGTTKYVAFTFDDGPSAATTPRLLDILARENVKVTFFVLGSLAARNPQIVARQIAEGHAVGSHSWNHANLAQMSSASITADLTKTANAIKNAGGVAPTLLRPPYGSTSRTLQNTAAFPLILWSVDTRDWESRNVNSVYNATVRSVKNGSIVLFHDIHATTVTAIDRLIPALKKAGYTFVTVPELLGQPLQNGKIYTGRR
ncbi:MAG: polysaccharide deacetylase family protein [Candidatus Nomurabacteria bacterium]|jgi:peptidoglycan/xylan/chitin deacetylase (PgdA/CDA1 family)|nr:polysaccharide deacetylase family protein [Candidatus Nomurabacteria bacterium]